MRGLQGDLEDFQRCIRPAQAQPRRPNNPKPSFYEGPPQRSGSAQERFFKVGLRLGGGVKQRGKIVGVWWTAKAVWLRPLLPCSSDFSRV